MFEEIALEAKLFYLDADKFQLQSKLQVLTSKCSQGIKNIEGRIRRNVAKLFIRN